MIKFDDATELEKKASPYFDLAYRKIWKIKTITVIRDTPRGIKEEIDKILTLEDGSQITIEEKIRDKKYINNDIVIEEQSNIEKNTPGWIYYSKADYLAYSWLQDGLSKILIFNMEKLREWYQKNKDKYNIIMTNTNNLYHTSFRIIPLEDIDIPFQIIQPNNNIQKIKCKTLGEWM